MTTSDDCDAAIALAYERTVTPGNYGTICLPYSAIRVEGATLYSIAYKEGDGIYLDEAENLVMGKPYIFLATADELVVRYWDGQAFTPSDDHLYSENGLVGYIEDGQTYSVTENAHNYILYQNGLWFVNSNNVKIRSERAFINWSNVPTSAPAQQGTPRRRIGIQHDMPTGVEQVAGDNAASKQIENGHLYIIHNGTKYNTQGFIVR